MKKRNLLVVGAMCLGLGLVGCSTTAPTSTNMVIKDAESDIVTVTATEKVKVEPDMAEVVYSVQNEAVDAEQCQKENAEKVKKVIDTLKTLGVDESKIQTSGYGLHPKYVWDKELETNNVVGYSMETEITLNDLGLDTLGNVLSESVKAGINNISYVNYKCSNYTDKYQEALSLAMTAAYDKAQTLALAGGATVSDLHTVTEHSSSYEPLYRNYSAAGKSMVADAAMNSMEDVVNPGEIEVEANITVSYYLTKTSR